MFKHSKNQSIDIGLELNYFFVLHKEQFGTYLTGYQDEPATTVSHD